MKKTWCSTSSSKMAVIDTPSGCLDGHHNISSGSYSTIPNRMSNMGSYSTTGYFVFVIFNSTGLTVSFYMLQVLTSDFLMRLEFQICHWAIYFTCYFAIAFMAPYDVIFFPACLNYLMKLLNRFLRRLTLWVRTRLLFLLRVTPTSQ